MSFESACLPVETTTQRGTGYLVSDRLVITCRHVIEDANKITVTVLGKPIVASPRPPDPQIKVAADVAVLELTEPVTGITPLKFASSANVGVDWLGQGYPVFRDRKALRLPLHGIVLSTNAFDINEEPSLQLSCVEAAAGDGPQMGGFSGSPVIIEGLVVGHIKRIFDDPDRPERPIYGLLYAVPSADILKLLGWEELATPPPPPPPDSNQKATEGFLKELKANSHSPSKIYGFMATLNSSGVSNEEVAAKAAQLLISQGRPELALQVLQNTGTGTMTQLMRARALYKLGDQDESLRILNLITQDECAEPYIYSETHGVLAGRYRDIYKQTGDKAYLRNSYTEYRKPWDRDQNTYCGINAATTALQLNDSETAKTIADQIAVALRDKKLEQLDHWERATMAEAQLLLNNQAEARKWYQLAVDHSPSLYSDLATIRDGARRILQTAGQPADLLDDTFPRLKVTAFFGHDVDQPDRVPPRFPRELVPAVGKLLTEKIKTMGIRFGVSSACRGSDLLFLRALLDSGGFATVILPYDTNEFVQMFVREQWRERFDYVRKHERTQLKIIAAEKDRDIWVACRDAIRKELRDRASSLSEQKQLLVVWDKSRSYVGDAVEAWQEEGDPVERVWPEAAPTVSTAVAP